MKKRLFAVTLLVCILLSGCAAEQISETEAAYTAQNKYFWLSMVYPFLENGSTFYGINARRMCYYDRQSGVSGILCPDPSCTHEDETCGANLQCSPDMICLYEGKIYWLGIESPQLPRSLCLYRCDPDGANREKVKTLDFEAINSNYAVQQWVLHQGKLFFYSERSAVDGTQAVYRHFFGFIALDGEEITALYDNTSEFSGGAKMFFCENEVYLAFSDWEHLTIQRYDLRDNSLTELLYTEFKEAYYIWVTEEGTLYLATDHGFFEMQNGVLRERFAFEMQGGYIYLGDGIAMTEKVIDEYRIAEIRDFDGNLIYKGKLFPESVKGFGETIGMSGKEIWPRYSHAVLGGDREKLIVIMGEANKDVVHYFCLDIRDKMKATHLWTIGTVTMYEPD